MEEESLKIWEEKGNVTQLQANGSDARANDAWSGIKKQDEEVEGH